MMEKGGEADPITTTEIDQLQRKLVIREKSEGETRRREVRDETLMPNPVRSFGYIKDSYRGFPRIFQE